MKSRRSSRAVESLPHVGVKEGWTRKDKVVYDKDGSVIGSFKTISTAKYFMRRGRNVV
jgi:hypothetical protein